MGLLSGIYDSALIQPVAKIKENLSIWTSGGWFHYVADYIEPIPPTPASTVDMVALAGLATLVANGTIAKRIVPILQLTEYEFLHLRWRPLDYVEGLLWELSGTGRFRTANLHSRVDPNTLIDDPHGALTTFWILGEQNRDMNLEVRNPMPWPTPLARFLFSGYRMILRPWDLTGLSGDVKTKLREGDLATVKNTIGTTTWLPTEGRG